MSSKPAVTTTTKAPLAGAQGNLLNNIWSGAGTATQNALNTPIPTQTVAGPTPAQQQGVQSILGAAPTLGTAAPATGNLLQQIASGYFTNPKNDPNFQGAVSAALDPTYQQLTRSILPKVQDVSLRAGGAGTGPSAYGGFGGGSPKDILTQNVLNDWSRNALNTTGSMAEGAYGRGLNLFSQIPGLASSFNQQSLAPGMAMLMAGGQQQGWNQGALQNLLNYYQMSTQNPLNFLNAGANIGTAGGFGTTTQTGAAPSMATQLLQGATGGASMLNSLFGASKGGTSAVSGLGSSLSGATDWLAGLGMPEWLATGLGTAAEAAPLGL